MEQNQSTNGAHANGARPMPEASAAEGEKTSPRVQRFYLVRHGQSTFNVEGRLPSQLPNVLLTDEGRRQAHQAAIALSGLRLSAIVSSPLERARETAEIIARGWSLPVQDEPRLMDTEMGRWAGRKISDVSKEDPTWREFVNKPTAPPEGIEGFEQVRQRTVAVIEDLRKRPDMGDDVVVVAHADVIKVIIAHYTDVALDSARFISISNASISALSFMDGHSPALMAVNWTITPQWLVSAAQSAPATADANSAVAKAEGAAQHATGESVTGEQPGVLM